MDAALKILDAIVADPNIDQRLKDIISANNYANARIKEQKESGLPAGYDQRNDTAPDGRKLGTI